MRLHDRFEWDDAKAKDNLARHGVAFEDAATALADESADRFHVERYDEAHSGYEERFITLASDPEDRSIVYAIVRMDREDEHRAVTRLISARMASRAERRSYEKQIHW